jgi:hypothetical protein
MPVISVRGTLPSIIVENTTAKGWAGSLALSGTTTMIKAIEVVGTGGGFFVASYDALRQLALVSPAALVDYEMFRSLGLTPVLDFQLQFNLTDGSVEVAPTVYHITVRNVDDTPPSGLAFSSGGSVTAGEIGSVIGTLRVTDVETTGPFYFSFSSADSWKYEVVGTTLKLKDGISLGLDDVGTMALPVLVSDGTQSAAFNLNVTVSAPGGQADLIHYLMPGDFTSLFYYNAANSVTGLRAAWEVSYVENYGQGVHAMMMRDGSALWLPPQVTQIHFADGWIDLSHTGSAAQVLALYRTILQRDPDPLGYNFVTGLLEGGMAIQTLTASMLQSPEYVARIGNPDNATFLNALYHDALGRAADPGGFAFQLARLNAGVSRTQLVDDFVLSTESMNNLQTAHADGFFVPTLYGKEVSMVYQVALGRYADPGGLTAWLGLLQTGQMSAGQLASTIGGSQEYINRYASFTDADFVTAMYHNALHRDPDPGGFSTWTGLLATHQVSRADMVTGFAFSAENYNNYNQLPGGLDLFHL